ncbi:unnamed protein product [Bathycoccus prasinos]
MTEKRAKELQLDAKWEAAIDVSLRRIVYGAIGGTTLAMLMCRGTTARTAVAAFGIGIGVGSAYEDASKLFNLPPLCCRDSSKSLDALLCPRQL